MLTISQRVENLSSALKKVPCLMKQLESKLNEVNQRHQTSFNLITSPGFSAAGDSTYFDSCHRKILFLKLNCRIWWLFDFDMIGAWRFYRDERLIGICAGTLQSVNRNVYFEFIFNDPKMSPISMAVEDQRTANLWNHRISLMLA